MSQRKSASNPDRKEMTLLSPEQFKSHFQVEGKTLSMSPHVAMMATFCGHNECVYVHPNNLLSEHKETYQSIIADLEDKDPSHPEQTLHNPSYMLWMKLAVENFLEDDGVLIFKMPLLCLRKLSRNPNYKIMDITEMYVNYGENYVIVKMYKRPYGGHTEITYSDHDEKIVCDISKTIVSPLYDQQVLKIIDSFINDPHKVEYKLIAGNNVKEKTSEDLREYGNCGLFMRTNATKIKFEPLECSKLKSSGVVFSFKDKETRDKYYSIVNTKKMIDLISLLSYNSTIPHSIIPLVLHPATLEYVQSV